MRIVALFWFMLAQLAKKNAREVSSDFAIALYSCAIDVVAPRSLILLPGRQGRSIIN